MWKRHYDNSFSTKVTHCINHVYPSIKCVLPIHSPRVLIHAFSGFLSEKKEKNSGCVPLLIPLLLSTPTFCVTRTMFTQVSNSHDHVKANLHYGYTVIMDTQFYQTSLQAVSALQLHNMMNYDGSYSCFHCQMSYAENLLVT